MAGLKSLLWGPILARGPYVWRLWYKCIMGLYTLSCVKSDQVYQLTMGNTFFLLHRVLYFFNSPCTSDGVSEVKCRTLNTYREICLLITYSTLFLCLLFSATAVRDLLPGLSFVRLSFPRTKFKYLFWDNWKGSWPVVIQASKDPLKKSRGSSAAVQCAASTWVCAHRFPAHPQQGRDQYIILKSASWFGIKDI